MAVAERPGESPPDQVRFTKYGLWVLGLCPITPVGSISTASTSVKATAMSEYEPTEEQRQLLAHDPSRHARVLAGPGTGKSTTIIALAARLSEGKPAGAVRLATFTRAATTELGEKALEQGVPVPITTVHGFALSVLQANPQWSRLPTPIRIPDNWERQVLILGDIRRRLSERWPGMRRRRVEKLQSEMAARWEAMDSTIQFESIDQDLRDAYVATWRRQREVFGYALFAEMPWYALELIEDHPEATTRDLEIFIVDEYQDLNACEMALVESLVSRGVIIIAVGDDDQSIYRFRMAAPEGIRTFREKLDSKDYPLSISHRCAQTIIEASQRLIRTSPAHDQSKKRLQPSDKNPEGDFAYWRFPSAQQERRAMAKQLLALNSDGIDFNKMAVLYRSDYQDRWGNAIRAELEKHKVPYTDVEGALAPLEEPNSRWLLAIARLILNNADDLAWWTLLHLHKGVSAEFIGAVADSAYEANDRFTARLRRLEAEPVKASEASAKKAIQLHTSVEQILATHREAPPDRTRAEWLAELLKIAQRAERPLSEAFQELLGLSATREGVDDQGLGALVNQLDLVARDKALEAPGVAVMTILRSKGLTFDVAITLGVEEEIFPLPNVEDPEEDRRLLYVAITRARHTSLLTMAKTRNDGTSRTGEGTFRSRSRVRFLADAGIYPVDRTAT